MWNSVKDIHDFDFLPGYETTSVIFFSSSWLSSSLALLIISSFFVCSFLKKSLCCNCFIFLWLCVYNLMSIFLFLLHRLLEIAQTRLPQQFQDDSSLKELASQVHIVSVQSCKNLMNRWQIYVIFFQLCLYVHALCIFFSLSSLNDNSKCSWAFCVLRNTNTHKDTFVQQFLIINIYCL